MAYTDIDKPSDYFETKLYTGNGGTLSVTGLDFQPDFSWLKCRGVAYNHRLYDVIRTPLDSLQSNSTAAESADGDGLSAFNSDGFTVTQGGNTEYNNNAVAYASWNWKANGAGSSNTDGSITSTVSANTTSGFSIVSYTGNASSGATIGHGLGSVPKMILVKNLSITSNWLVYNYSMSANGDYALFLDSTSAKDNSQDYWGDTTPTSSVFSVGARQEANGSGNSQIAYCFADVKGYSKFGSYTGNGNADGPFVYTGFKPAFVIQKRTDSTSNWTMVDNKRDVDNVVNTQLVANGTGAEFSENVFDFLSNGFKIRAVHGGYLNASGGSYIYMAFAENPFVTSTGVPATAR